MKNRILVLLLVLALVFGGAVTARADTTGAANGATPAQAVKSLSLEEALKLAEENNAEIYKARVGLQKAQIQLDKAESGYEKIQDAQDAPYVGYLYSTYDTAGMAFVGKESAAAYLKVAQKSYEVAHEQIKLLIKSKYYAVLEKKDTVAVKEAALQRAQKQLDIANASFKVGSVAKNDVLRAEMGLASARADLTGARNEYQLAVIELNRAIGLDINTPLNLTTKVDKQDILGDVKLEQFIDEALKNRLDVARDEAAVEVADKTYQTLLTYKGGKSYDARLAKADLEVARRNLEETRKAVAAGITGAYLNVQSAAQRLAFLEKAVEQARENLRLAELRYQVGVGTNLELLDAMVNLNDMETNRVKALYGYNLAKMVFETAKLAPASL